MDFIKSILKSSNRVRTSDEINQIAIKNIKLHNIGSVATYGGITYHYKDTDTYVTIESNWRVCNTKVFI